MKFIFLMNPLEGVVFGTDTTFALMLGAHNRGHDVYYVPQDGITLVEGKVYFHALKVVPQSIEHMPFEQEEHVRRLGADEIDAVFLRPDPPMDERYIMNTWALDHLPKRVA